ncbi:MAG: SurA N-terminal domain-containing protein [Candidatus Cohnella colombiensis]|uniref:SurA N-terminal domain-containing protein n=1 Tax=Candidatus Cohnella colombiensis TaxID=3121368 RepID=A0AA95EZT4_9BACL|nr:MAG: SurA N-terminal domain-containing protein [Cohnella sp.]
MNKPAQPWVWMTTSAILLVALIVYIVIYPPGDKVITGTDAVVKVNDTSISKNELFDALVAAGGGQTLDTLVSSELIRQEMEKQGLVLTDEDYEKELETIKQSVGSEEDFQSLLSMYGMTVEDLKKELKSQAQLRKLLEDQVSITDEQIKTYYDENLEDLTVDGVAPTLEAKTEEIRATLMDEQLSTLSATWLEEQKTKSNIEYFIDL